MVTAENGGLERRRKGITTEDSERRTTLAVGRPIVSDVPRVCEHGGKPCYEIAVGYVILDIYVSLLVLEERTDDIKRTTSLKWRIVSSWSLVTEPMMASQINAKGVINPNIGRNPYDGSTMPYLFSSRPSSAPASGARMWRKGQRAPKRVKAEWVCVRLRTDLYVSIQILYMTP
jgi:hypothetical protein